MPWEFEISTGNMHNPSGAVIESGYSGGNVGKDPEGVNNPDDEGLKDIGPLPEGTYTFGEPVEHSELGVFAIPLIPDPSNDMRGRGGFYCHGDTAAMDHSASEGCIIMSRATRNAMWESEDHVLKVTR
jgi:hypothetical protein